MRRFHLILLLNVLIICYVYPQEAEKAYKKYTRCINQEDREKVQKFLNKGFDINARDSDGKTPLLYCLQQNKPDFARFLIDEGADIYLTDYRGNTCLHYAIENCSPDSIVYELIKAGVNFRVTNNEGYSPFHFSILFSCPDLSFYLIGKGADYYLVTGLNENSLHLSIESGCDTLSYYLLEHDIDTRQPNNRGNTPLLSAMDFRRHDIAVKLINMGADIHVWNNDSLDALFFAVVNQDTGIVNILLEKGAKIKRPMNREPLIYIAASNEDEEITKQLLLHGAEYPAACENNDMCYNSAFVYYVNAEVADDTLKTDFILKSLSAYKKAKEMYMNELNGVRVDNTFKFFAEIAIAAAVDTYPNFDYEAERRYYLKDQIGKCETHIAKLEKSLASLTNTEIPGKEENEQGEPVSDTLNVESP